MALVSEQVPTGEGANSSIDYGQQTQAGRMQREMESRAGTAQSQARGQAPPPQAAPPQPPTPQGPTQPEPQPQGRLSMDQVFPPMPELQQNMPWRDIIRQQAEIWNAHPQAGPAWNKFREDI